MATAMPFCTVHCMHIHTHIQIGPLMDAFFPHYAYENANVFLLALHVTGAPYVVLYPLFLMKNHSSQERRTYDSILCTS